MNRKFPLKPCRRGRYCSDQISDFTLANGFTLMELLIVIAIILILMLMAIPTIGVMKKNANETSAINSLRAITQAEIQYESTYPASGYSCTLGALGGDPASGVPTPTGAQLLQSDLASGYKSGYNFAIGNCTKVTIAGTDRITGYTLTAVPAAVGKTGNRGFCTDQFGGAPKYDATGGTNCTQPLQ
jgi:type IV pilus assembly protein PilA